MDINLNELNRVLLAIKQISSRQRWVSRSFLFEYLRDEVILGSNPDFEPVVDFMKCLQLILIEKRGICLSGLGLELLSENSIELYELQPRQCRLLVRKCYLDGALRKETKLFLKYFSFKLIDGNIVWSSIDSEPFGELEWLSRHLIQLGVLLQQKHLLIVTSEYHDMISQFIDEGSDFSDIQMEEYLREKRQLSQVAEYFVVIYEKERLKRSGHTLESACVNLISNVRVNAGYDINSYNGPSLGMNHDRFIEVKGSGKVTVRFIWSPNEIKKASELGDQYWIYFVGGINKKKRTVSREPVMLQNPLSILYSDTRFSVQSDGKQLVTADVCGKPLARITRVNI